MGKSGVKRATKSGKVSADVMGSIVDQLNTLSDSIGELKLQAVTDLGVIAEAFTAQNKRLSSLEQLTQPLVIDTTKLTEDILKRLKDSKPEPVYVSTPPEKVSQWRNAEERCAHTFKAVQAALSVMHGINYTVGTTSFTVRVRCQGTYRPINVHFNGTKHCMMDYYRRSDQYEQVEFENTTQAAARIVALCMYYATR